MRQLVGDQSAVGAAAAAPGSAASVRLSCRLSSDADRHMAQLALREWRLPQGAVP